MTTQGGPAQPVVVASAGALAGPALPVAVVSDGRVVAGGPAMRVIEVADGRPTFGGPALPVAAVSDGRPILGGPAVPVVVVAGSLKSAYTNKIVGLGPIGYWPQAESSGTTIVDESGNARNGIYSNVTLGAVGIGDGRTAASYNGTTSYGNIYTAGLAAAFNGSELSILLWFQMSGSGVWTDGLTRRCIYVAADASNYVRMFKGSINNNFQWTYNAGGTVKGASTSMSPTTWQHVAITVSKANDRMRAYLNGTSIATLTGLGVWAGTPASTTCVIGATTTVPVEVHSGLLAHTAIFDRELSAAEILTAATV